MTMEKKAPLAATAAEICGNSRSVKAAEHSKTLADIERRVETKTAQIRAGK